MREIFLVKLKVQSTDRNWPILRLKQEWEESDEDKKEKSRKCKCNNQKAEHHFLFPICCGGTESFKNEKNWYPLQGWCGHWCAELCYSAKQNKYQHLDAAFCWGALHPLSFYCKGKLDSFAFSCFTQKNQLNERWFKLKVKWAKLRQEESSGSSAHTIS